MMAHSEGVYSLCAQSTMGVVGKGVMQPAVSGVAESEEAFEDMAFRSASVGVVGAVWKKSKGDPKRKK